MSEQGRAPARPLWDYINDVCAARGWSWSRLERESGVSRKTLANWKTQPRQPQSENVNAVADALGVDRMHALRLAGILTRPPEEEDLTAISDDELDARLNETGTELERLNKERERREGQRRTAI